MKINWIHLLPPFPPKVDKIAHPIKLYAAVPYIMLENQIKVR